MYRNREAVEAVYFVIGLVLYLYPPIWACQRAYGAFVRRSRPFQFGLAELLLVTILIPFATMAFLYTGYPLVVGAVLLYQVAFALYFWTRSNPGDTSTVLLLLSGMLLGTIIFIVWFALITILAGLIGALFTRPDHIRDK